LQPEPSSKTRAIAPGSPKALRVSSLVRKRSSTVIGKPTSRASAPRASNVASATSGTSRRCVLRTHRFNMLIRMVSLADGCAHHSLCARDGEERMAPRGSSKSKKVSSKKSPGKAPAARTGAKAAKPATKPIAKGTAKATPKAEMKAAAAPKKKAAAKPTKAAKGTAKKPRAAAPKQTSMFGAVVQKALPLIPGVGRWIGRTVG